jgi:antitoxin FitA
MTGDVHHDGGQLRQAAVAHRQIIEHHDGSVSAVVIRGVPALVCDLCEEVFYETQVTDGVVRLLERTEVAPGRAITVDYGPRRIEPKAVERGRSVEAETHSILTAALAPGGLTQAWVEATDDVPGDEVPLPDRSAPRQVDFG